MVIHRDRVWVRKDHSDPRGLAAPLCYVATGYQGPRAPDGEHHHAYLRYDKKDIMWARRGAPCAPRTAQNYAQNYAKLRKITQALRKNTHVLRKSVTQALRRYYAKYARVTQINYADITQYLRINYAKMITHNTQALRKYVYA